MSALLTGKVRDFAVKRRFVDDARSVRNVHRQSVPRMGGIAFVSSWLMATALMLALSPTLREAFWIRRPRSIVFLFGALAATALGVIDDVRGLRARYKLAAQAAIGLLLCAAGLTVHDIQLPGGILIPLGYLAVPLTVLWISGVMNAMNLIDGLDGLAAGVAAIALATMFVVALMVGNPLLAVYSAALFGALLGFLIYNFNPASIFMGDGGSLFLGYFLAVAVIVPMRQSEANGLKVVLPLVILGVPILDTAFAIARRLLRGRKVFSPDREHLHHRLLARGMSHRAAVITLYAVCAALGIAGVAMAFGGPYLEILVGTGLICAAVSALRLLGFFGLKLDGLRATRHSNQDLRTSVKHIAGRLEQVVHIHEVFESLQPLAGAVSASAIIVRIGTARSEHRREPASERDFQASFSVTQGRRTVGNVVVVWGDGREQLEDDHALAIEEVCENVARTVSRVWPGTVISPLPAPAVRRALGS